MASEGMKFTEAYAACTVCSPTRASIMTGQYPARLHLTDFIAGQVRPWAKLTVPDWKKGLLHEHKTIAEALKAKGYRTGMVGKWHLNRRGHEKEDAPIKHGFDVEYQRPPGTRGYLLPKGSDKSYLTDHLTDQAVTFIRESKTEGKPMFLYMAYNVPHTPIQGREDLVAEFEKRVSATAVHKNPTYAAMVASLDESVGRILATLKEESLSENTLVIFTSDNGG
ncbi:MAG: sulfatase-like hydrolase/transferase, partial [Verrucomicrobiales bacterium]